MDNRSVIPVIFIAGYSNSGKTTVIVEIVKIMKTRGYEIAVVKHASHGYQLDSEGKDSYRFYQAGADKVVVAGPKSLTIHERYDSLPSLGEICERIAGVDLIIVEGFKRNPGPKIEVFRKNFSTGPLSQRENIIAIVSDEPMEEGVPCYSLAMLEELVDFIIKHNAIKKTIINIDNKDLSGRAE